MLYTRLFYTHLFFLLFFAGLVQTIAGEARRLAGAADALHSFFFLFLRTLSRLSLAKNTDLPALQAQILKIPLYMPIYGKFAGQLTFQNVSCRTKSP